VKINSYHAGNVTTDHSTSLQRKSGWFKNGLPFIIYNTSQFSTEN